MRKKLRRFKRKAHNFILKTITVIAAIMLMLSICALDSPSCIPLIVCVVSISWLGIVAYANGMMNDYEEEGDLHEYLRAEVDDYVG